MIRSTVKFLLFTVLFFVPFFASAQLTANFTADDTAGCAPMVVHFTNTSTGATSYDWDLGNGTLSTLTDVSGAYLTAGTYTITLIARNGSASNTKTMTIRVYGLPTVNFFASDTTICPGGSVVFTSTSTSGAWGGMTYNWNFGDGYSSTVASPTHSYGTPGNMNVTLFVTNSKGCINSRSRLPYIRVSPPPSVGFTPASTMYCHPVAGVPFANSTVGVPPLINSWRFGDGGVSGLSNPTHNYTTSGIFDVSLKVTDGNGCIDSAVFPGLITVGDLAASYTYPSISCPFAPVTFTNTSTTHISANWDFGDGGTSTDEVPVHTYTTVGTYPVQLVVYDGTCFDTVVHSITITKPTGSFNVTPLRPCAPPQTLTFHGSVPPGCSVSWYSLVFGSLGSGVTLSHLFPPVTIESVQYGFIDSVTMVITDTHGCKDTVGQRDTVNYLRVSIGGGPHEGCSPVRDSFQADAISSVWDPFLGPPFYSTGYMPYPYLTAFPYPYSISNYSWNFGDGSPVSTAPMPGHTYSVVGGVYNTNVSIVSSNGCTATAPPQIVKVGSVPPTPSFTFHPSHACAGRPFYFTASGSGTFDHYKWDFGDGNPDTSASPVHIYTVPGIFQVDLKTVYNGCQSFHYALRDTVDSPSAVAHISYACIPRNVVSFSDYSLGDDSHLWSFGDGFTTTAANPVHTYPSVSIYSVTLTTSNTRSGCRDTGRYVINLNHLNTSFTTFHPTICKGILDTFADTVFNKTFIDSTYVTKYKWYADGIVTDSLVTFYTADTIYHAFSTAGTHSVALVLTDNHGCLDTLSTTVVVPNPIDSFNFSPPSGCAPLAVTFTDRSTDIPGATITNYFWKWGDGTTSSTSSPVISHNYNLNGSYAIKEIVTDNSGCKDSLVSHTRVVVRKPTAAFNTTVTTICRHRGIRFNNTTAGTFTSLWLFGDGDTSSATNPTHFFHSAGDFTVKLVVTDVGGCRDTLTKTNYIHVKPLPVPAFTMDDSFSVCSPFTVNFTNRSTGATRYFWTFGDGTSSIVDSPSAVYITPGYYTVKLQAINSFNCSDTAVRHVNLFGYSGAFTYAPISGCNPVTTHFSATISSVASVVWDFSDGVTSVPSLSTVATHVYSTVGTFVPKLILTDSFGCTNFSVGHDTIKVDNINAGFTTTPNPGCQNSAMVFNDTSSSHFSPITRWLWTLAPGYTSTVSNPTYTYTSAGTHPVTLSITDAWGCTSVITKNVTVNALPSVIAGPSTVCIGTTITLTDTITGGTWVSSNPSIAKVGSSTGIVTGMALGSVTITYSLGSGCTITKTITVNPVLTPISGSSGVCVGSTTLFTDPTPGGFWSSGSPGIANIGSLSGTISGVAAGVANISYTQAGCTTTKPITVNPLPSTFTGNVPICILRTTTLGSTPSGGTWTGGTGVATVSPSGGVVTGITAGLDIITYTLPTTCKTTATVTVNNPPAAIAGGSFVCIGGTVTLADITPGGTWSSSNTAIVTIGSTSGMATGVAVGSATVSYTAGGCSATKVISVNTLPGPITGNRSICVGLSDTLSHPTSGGTWTSSIPGVAVVGASNGIVYGVNNGNSTITYSLGAGCEVTTVFTVNPLPAPIGGTASVCVGATSILTDITPGGTWRCDSVSIATIDASSGTLTGVSGGLAYITYTIPTGCVRIRQSTINAVPRITGLTNMCSLGDTIIVHNANTLGLYSSTVVTVRNLGGGTALVISSSPGIGSVSYTIPLGCVITQPVTVNPTPPAIIGATHFCEGTTSPLSDSLTGGRWYSSNIYVARIDSFTGIMTGIAGGSATISYSLPTTCKVKVPVTVEPIPLAGTIRGATSLCMGQTITLVDSFLGGIWTASNAHATVSGGNVFGVSAGIDTIKYVVTNPCGTSSAIHIVTLKQAPDAGTINGPVSLCVGETITLTDSAAGGVWASANANATVLNGVVKGIAPGIDTISYTSTNTCGVDIAKHGLVINPQPYAGVFSGPLFVCVGDTITIANSVSGGILGITNSNATLDGWVVTGITPGFDTVTYAVTNSCGTATTGKQVEIVPLPVAGTITGPTDVCVGDTIELSASIPGGTWSASNNLAHISGSLTVIGADAGRETITYSVSNICGTATTTESITIDPLPNGLTILRNDYQLSVASGYAAYQWTLNGKPIKGATNNTYTFLTTGEYGISVTNATGCSYTYAPLKITDCAIADINIFPNPVESTIYIQWCKQVTAQISCLDGKFVKEISNTNEVNIRELPNGVYSLTIYDSFNNKILTKRITKVTR